MQNRALHMSHSLKPVGSQGPCGGLPCESPSNFVSQTASRGQTLVTAYGLAKFASLSFIVSSALITVIKAF